MITLQTVAKIIDPGAFADDASVTTDSGARARLRRQTAARNKAERIVKFIKRGTLK